MPEHEVDGAIRSLVERARRDAEPVVWCMYGHHRPSDLPDRLEAAGFVPEPREQFMVLDVDEAAIDRFAECKAQVVRITGDPGLRAVARVLEDTGRPQVDRDIQRLAEVLARAPAQMSVYVAFVDGVPAACGRIHYDELMPGMADLSGGRTRPAFRNRGLYLGLVRARLREALGRGYSQVAVDVLPTSAPHLRRRGFEPVTWKQEFVYAPSPSNPAPGTDRRGRP